jgi:hypothetical protein
VQFIIEKQVPLHVSHYWFNFRSPMIGFGYQLQKMVKIWAAYVGGKKVLCCIRQNYAAIDISFILFHLTKNSVFTSVFKGISEKSFYIFIYKLILIKIYVNANIINTQIVYLIKYDLKGHLGSQNATFIFILSLTCDLMDNFFICPCHIMLQIQIFPQSSF